MHGQKVAALALLAASAMMATACLSLGVLGWPRPAARAVAARAAERRSLFDVEPPSNKEGYYQWMWGDVDELGDHELAEANPFRWSDWLNAAGTIADLEAYKTIESQDRPVEIARGVDIVDGFVQPLKFGNLGEAIAYLSTQTTTQAPVVVEKTKKVVVPGKCPDADTLSHVDELEALCFMAIGSAATIALYVVCQCCACVCRRVCCCSRKDTADNDVVGLKDKADSDSEAMDIKPRLAITEGRAPQPYQGQFQESELRALLADIEDEELKALPGMPRPLCPGGVDEAAAMRAEAAREAERVLGARGAREIFGAGSIAEQRAQYRRLVRLFHPDKKILEGQRASLALRRVVEAYRSHMEAA